MIFPSLLLLSVALPVVILIEAAILKSRLPEYSHKAVRAATFANLVSTFLGVPAAWLAMLTLSLFLGGGGAEFETTWDKVLSVTRDAAWFYPFEDWQLPAAQLVLLVPFFFVSWRLETGIVARSFGVTPTAVRRSCLVANLVTYLMQGMVVLSIFLAHKAGIFADFSNRDLRSFRSDFSSEIAFIQQTANEIPKHIREIPDSGGKREIDGEWLWSVVDSVDCTVFLNFEVFHDPGPYAIGEEFSTVERCDVRDRATEIGRKTEFGEISEAIYSAPLSEPSDKEKSLDGQAVYRIGLIRADGDGFFRIRATLRKM